MPLQAAPPDTSAYMIAGYTVFAFIMAIYLASLFIRGRNLDEDLRTLEDLQARNEPPMSTKVPSRGEGKARARRPRTQAGRRRPARKKVAKRGS